MATTLKTPQSIDGELAKAFLASVAKEVIREYADGSETMCPGVSWRAATNGPLDTIPHVTVPAGHLFVMGDNRDNSADSRLDQSSGGVGLLPLWNLQGKAFVIAASRDTKVSTGSVSEAPGSIRFQRFFSWVK